MALKNTSMSRATVTTLSALMAAAVLTVLPVLSLPASPVLAAPQAAQLCVEDFTSDTDPAIPGFAGSVFTHTISGSFILGPSCRNIGCGQQAAKDTQFERIPHLRRVQLGPSQWRARPRQVSFC